MNAIILTATWGVVMMLGGAFIKSKSTPKYLAITGLVLIIIANCIQMNNGASFFTVDVKNMLVFDSFNLTFINVVFGCTLLYFLLNGRDIEKWENMFRNILRCCFLFYAALPSYPHSIPC